MFIKKFIGDKSFYKKVMAVALPIMVQEAITNFVSLLDNIMVGRVGTEAMSGVAIVNQLFFVYYLCIFGAVAGVGIFTAQYYGKNDTEGVRYTFRYKIMASVVITVACALAFLLFPDTLINLFLHDNGTSSGDISATLGYAKSYMLIMIVGMLPNSIKTAYAMTLRECGETMVPMKAGITAVIVNLVFNYIFIFGKLGVPALGSSGAAIATVISRFVELFIVVIWTHSHKKQNEFIIGVYKSPKIPLNLAKQFTVKGIPIFINEFLWSFGTTMVVQCYSLRGLSAVAAFNISSTVSNLFNVVFISLGSSVGIIIGQLLGANKIEQAKDEDRKLIAFSVSVCLITGSVLAILAPFIPQIYNTTEDVRILATHFMWLHAFFMSFDSFAHATYFTLRSGGKTFVTFVFDSIFACCITVPVAYVFSNFTDFRIEYVVMFTQFTIVIKSFIGYLFLRKGDWAKKIV